MATGATEPLLTARPYHVLPDACPITPARNDRYLKSYSRSQLQRMLFLKQMCGTQYLHTRGILPGPTACSCAALADITTPINDRYFPYARCTDYDCSSTPWKLEFESQQAQLVNNMRMVCMRIRRVRCPADNICCQALSTKLDKLEFSVGGWHGWTPCSCVHLYAWVYA
jgi:hypothetical protein